MLADAELAHLAVQHSRYTTENYKHYETQRELLVKYKEIVAEYGKLKKSYDELTDGKESSPFVLVLIDGDTYRFEEALLSRREEGGISSARLLGDSIQSCLTDTPLEKYQVVVRVYCNLAETSKVLSRSRLCGAEKRSLGPFAAGFTASTENYEFIDAGDRPDAVFNKINDAVNLFAESSSCKHVLLGSCNSAHYADLAASNRNNVTLVKSAPFDTKAVRSALNPDISATRLSTTSNTAGPTNGDFESAHLPSKWSTRAERAKGSVISPSHSDAPPSQKLRPFRPAPPSVNGEDEPRGNHSNPTATFFVAKPENAGQVPINQHGQRLDGHIPRPSKDAWAAFSQRVVRGTKLCNAFHLEGACDGGGDCRFDHNPIDEDVLSALRSLARSLPCPRRTHCRWSRCINGHICAKPGCPGQGKFCKLRPHMHGLDGRLDAWVPASDADEATIHTKSTVAARWRERDSSAGVSLGPHSDQDGDDWLGGGDRDHDAQADHGLEAPGDESEEDQDLPQGNPASNGQGPSSSRKGNGWHERDTTWESRGTKFDSAADWPGPQWGHHKTVVQGGRATTNDTQRFAGRSDLLSDLDGADDAEPGLSEKSDVANGNQWSTNDRDWEPTTSKDDRNISW